MGSTKKLAGKVAIVTGAGGGIGGAIGKRLAEAGARVACADVDAAAAAATARAITGVGGKAIVCHNDVSKENQAEAVVQATLGAFGAVQILVNYAEAVAPTATTTSTGPMMRRSTAPPSSRRQSRLRWTGR